MCMEIDNPYDFYDDATFSMSLEFKQSGKNSSSIVLAQTLGLSREKCKDNCTDRFISDDRHLAHFLFTLLPPDKNFPACTKRLNGIPFS